MEANPPSYGQATTVNAWDLIADYIPSSDLCSAALVCQQWHAIFAPHLWGNPASHFGHENDRVYGLQQALRRFDALLYLDLSWTYPAKNPEVLRSLSQFRGLQVLKLRGISLRDDDVLMLADAIKTRVRSLDLRNNQLTDRSIRILLEQCFIPPPRRDNDGHVMSPSLLPYLGAEMLSTYRGVNFEAYLRNEFTNKFVGRLAIEDAPESGITHLYLSDNQFTVEGLSGLVRSGRLHVLDAGSLLPAMASRDGSFSMSFPSLAKLVPVLAESASHSLTYLRIDHSLVTEEPPIVQESVKESTPQRCELADTSNYPCGVAELDRDTEVYEMLGDTSFPTEVSGDAVSIVVTPTGFEKPAASIHQARRRSQDLPIPVQTEEMNESGLHITTLEQENDRSIPVLDEASTPSPSLPSHNLGRSYSSIVKERKDRLQAHLSQAKGFHPGILPHLTTLVLTEVPPSSPTQDTSKRLVSFIHACAEETALAKLQAQLDWTLPPGRRTIHSHQKELLRKSFALEQIVLEVAPCSLDQKKSEAASAWRHRGTKSVTQDQDSEALWAASQTDFSFFGEGETNSLDTYLEPTKPLTIMSGMEVSVGHPPSSSHQLQGNPVNDDPKPEIDVIAELSKFRKATKSEYQKRQAEGEEEPTVEGFWDGNIKVVRKSKDVDPRFEDDEVWADYYGNRFSNGYLYR
ncbi:hypothetical protein KCV07_g6265, partial [Aureobasidium melanogenum]